jgi:hypothetical protein
MSFNKLPAEERIKNPGTEEQDEIRPCFRVQIAAGA